MNCNSICVVGLGYIGLPTALMFAKSGYKVCGFDNDPTVVNSLNNGHAHIIEDGIDDELNTSLSNGSFKAYNELQKSDVYIIAVPTPFLDGQPDLTYVYDALNQIAIQLKKGDMLILESTSPVGTTEKLAKKIAGLRSDLNLTHESASHPDLNIVYCPERVLPGKIFSELIENDRVFGGLTQTCSKRAIKLYQSFVKGKCISTSSKEAELCKLVENASRDNQIAFANELSLICDKQNVCCRTVIKLANMHPRVNILEPGPGVGGHCIAVDPWFIISQNKSLSLLMQTARKINDSKKEWVIQKVLSKVDEYLESNTNVSCEDIVITCFGVTFKANIDDLRESPSLFIANSLSKKHEGKVYIVEPHIKKNVVATETQLQNITKEQAFKVTHIAVILVKHDVFFEYESQFWKNKIVIDICGLLFK